MPWPELAGIMVPVIVTGVVAIFSARYGAKSSIDAAERQVRASIEVANKNNQAALQRIQYERLIHKREETIEELYAGLRDLDRKFFSVRNPVLGASIEDKQRTSQEFEQLLGEVRSHFDRRAIWLDDRTTHAIDQLLSDYLGHIGYLNMTIYPTNVENFVPGGSEYQGALMKLDKWAEETYPELEKTIENGLKSSLGIADDSTNVTHE